MTNQFRPASTSDVLPPVQRYAPACRAEASNESDSRITHHASRPEQLQTDPSTPDHQLSTNDHQPSTRASKPKTRRGKVARLPYAQRDMINRMLRNNIPQSKIVGALDEHGIKATERNISNWKTRGGYRNWCAEQDRALETRLLQDNLLEHLRTNDASQLPEIGLQLAATELSQFFLKSETRQQLTSEPEKCFRSLGMLCRLARQIHTLQKYRDDCAKELGTEYNPEQIKRETEQILESTRNTYSSFIPDNAPIEPEIPHRNFIPKSGCLDPGSL